MYSVSSLEYAVERLFLDGIGENGYTDGEIEKLLAHMNYVSLLQAVRHKAKTVYAYTTRGKAPKAFKEPLIKSGKCHLSPTRARI